MRLQPLATAPRPDEALRIFYKVAIDARAAHALEAQLPSGDLDSALAAPEDGREGTCRLFEMNGIPVDAQTRAKVSLNELLRL